MRSIGVRELRQNASEYLRLVEAGETFEITERGKPVAQLVPLPDRGSSVLDRLIREGRATRPAGKIDLLSVEPIQLPAGAKTPSEYLQEMREDER